VYIIANSSNLSTVFCIFMLLLHNICTVLSQLLCLLFHYYTGIREKVNLFLPGFCCFSATSYTYKSTTYNAYFCDFFKQKKCFLPAAVIVEYQEES